jgi:hypothetical protein
MFGSITGGFYQLIALTQFLLVIWSLIHISRTRPDAFVAVNKQTKQFWTLVLGGALILGSIVGVFRILGLIAALIYVLDVRPAVDEVQRPR